VRSVPTLHAPAWAQLCGIVALSAACTVAPNAMSSGSLGADWEYTAVLDATATHLEVEARLGEPLGRELVVRERAAPFVAGAEWWDGRRWRTLPGAGGIWQLPAAARAPLQVRYRYALQAAAEALEPRSLREGVVAAPPSQWTMRPRGFDGASILYRVRDRASMRFVTGMFDDPASGASAFRLRAGDLARDPYCAFGDFELHALEVGGARIQVAMMPGFRGVGSEALLDWVEEAAEQVSDYYSGFPVPRLLVQVRASGWRGGTFGRTFGRGGAWIEGYVGRRTDAAGLADDWIMAHEMSHLGLPMLDRRHHWMEEGVATYLESVVRARAGNKSAEDFWVKMAEGLPNGQPGPDDRGLDRTATWGRTYWGGALFWFTADLEIRRRTRGARGLEEALRGIVAAGGDMSVHWPVQRVLATGDGATGTQVLTELYAAWRETPVTVDLEAVFAGLGVNVERDRVRWDDDAPEAWLRNALTTPGSPE